MPKDWQRTAQRDVVDCRVFKVRADTSVHPLTGVAAEYFVIDSSDWVNVIALTPTRDVVLIEQYRHGARKITLELPGGTLEPGEDPLVAGLRELQEETGYGGGTARLIGYCEPNPAIQSNRCWFVLVDGATLISATNFDDGEDIDLRLAPLGDVPRLIAAGEITHALVLAAFQRFGS